MPATSSEAVTQPTAEWVAQTGPALLRLSRARDLTPYEQRTLAAVKAVCPCHRTDHPEEYSSNGENCDLCGRVIGVIRSGCCA